MREYTVKDVPINGIGGEEYHKIRKEIVQVIKGKFLWTLENKNGEKEEIILSPESEGIVIEPNILHIYKSLEEKSSLRIIANTLYNPDDPMTHDTYSAEDF